MLELEENKRFLNSLKDKLENIRESMKIDSLNNELETLRKESLAENFWQDTEKSSKVYSRIKTLEKRIGNYENLFKELSNLLEMNELLEVEFEDELLNELLKSSKILANKLDELEGLKSVTALISGENAYGYLKGEMGVHRLVRISPFDSGGRRHTSFASLEVLPEITDDVEIEISPDDLRIDTYRASGAGGQHINKTDSAVRITHIPTNIVVACQSERSQTMNKETAMRMLKSKLLDLKERENSEKMAELKGEQKEIAWGSQIRSYVFCPYTMVKDHRTGYEVGNVQGVMDGDLNEFMKAYLKMLANN